MSKARMIGAGAGGTQYGVLTSTDQGGGDKKQGLVSTTNSPVSLDAFIRIRGGGHNRNWIFCMNQLGGVGRRWGQASGPGNRGGVSMNCQRLAYRRRIRYPPKPCGAQARGWGVGVKYPPLCRPEQVADPDAPQPWGQSASGAWNTPLVHAHVVPVPSAQVFDRACGWQDPSAAPAVNGLLFYGSDDGKVHAVSAHDGKEAWAFPLTGGAPVTQLVWTQTSDSGDSLIRYGCEDGKVGGIKLSAAGSPVGQWALDASDYTYPPPPQLPPIAVTSASVTALLQISFADDPGLEKSPLLLVVAVKGTDPLGPPWVLCVLSGGSTVDSSSGNLIPPKTTTAIQAEDVAVVGGMAYSGTTRALPTTDDDSLLMYWATKDHIQTATLGLKTPFVGVARRGEAWPKYPDGVEVGGPARLGMAIAWPTSSKDPHLYCTGGNHLYALNALTGDVMWNYDTGGPVESIPVASEDGNTVYVKSIVNTSQGLEQEWVYSLHTDGGVQWSTLLNDDARCCPACSTGRLPPPSSLALTQSTKQVKGALYCGTWDGQVASLDVDHGSVMWNLQVVYGGQSVVSTPVLSPYVYCNDKFPSGMLLYVNTSTCQEDTSDKGVIAAMCYAGATATYGACCPAFDPGQCR